MHNSRHLSKLLSNSMYRASGIIHNRILLGKSIIDIEKNYAEERPYIAQGVQKATKPDVRDLPRESNDLSALQDNKIDNVVGLREVIDKESKASPEQLNQIADALVQHLPKFFAQPHPFILYTKDMVYIDNIRAIRLQGLAQYAARIALVKFYYGLRYAQIKVEILNLVKLPEESCIKIRWRLVTKPGQIQALIFFYRYHMMENWVDAISTMYVNKDGNIYCHICDNIDVETDDLKAKKVVKSPLVNRGLNV